MIYIEELWDFFFLLMCTPAPETFPPSSSRTATWEMIWLHSLQETQIGHNLKKRPFRGFQNKVNFKTNRQQAKLKWSYNKDQQQGGALFLLLQPLPKIPSDARAGVGGRLSHFIKEWAEITSNPFILQMIEVTGWNSKTPHPRGFFLPICRGTKRDGRPLWIWLWCGKRRGLFLPFWKIKNSEDFILASLW